MSKTLMSLAGLALTAMVIVLTACGEDESNDDAVRTDGAFITAMTEHHDGAVEMAQIAEDRAERPQIRRLAGEIIDAQTTEIDHMGEIHERLFGERPGEADHGTMGMSAHEMGMDMDMATLDDAEPFDRAFIDAMVAHHQGAIRMARVELEQGSDARLHDLCEEIIEAQSREIEQMNDWRRRWYGAPAPAGGIPPEGQPMPSHAEMGH